MITPFPALCRNIACTFVFMAPVAFAFAQATTPPSLRLYAVAVVVSDAEVSSSWYQSIFGLELRNRNDSPERGSKIAVLTANNFLVELIEKKTSMTQKNILLGKPSQTLIQGFSKIGFYVTDLDACIQRLQELRVKFFGDIYTDAVSKKRSFIILDPDDNMIQIFE